MDKCGATWAYAMLLLVGCIDRETIDACANACAPKGMRSWSRDIGCVCDVSTVDAGAVDDADPENAERR